jgi:putative salt-induced outer membrane protein
MFLYPLLALALAQAAAAQAPAEPQALPEPVRAMVDAALASGDAKMIEHVLLLAGQTNPGAAAELQGIESAYRKKVAAEQTRAEEERLARIANAGMLDSWSGQVEMGAARSTGNSDTLGLYGAANLTREGLQWRHKLDARVDVQETAGATTTERVLAAWQPNYKVDDRLYTFGLAQYEHDRFLGYSNRYTLGGGAGYGVIAGEKVKLDVEGGPAYRYTDVIDGPNDAKLAGRASMTFNWQVTPTVQFVQAGSLYLEDGDSSASASTTLDTKLVGALKARFSYNIQYERNAPPGVNAIDTLSRATLVLSF